MPESASTGSGRTVNSRAKLTHLRASRSDPPSGEEWTGHGPPAAPDDAKRVVDSHDVTDVVHFRALPRHGGGGAAIVNEVELAYDELWQISAIAQQHDGVVDTNSPTVGYAYAIEPMATGNFSRQTELVYPDGWILETTYGASGSIDDRISRAASLRDEDTSDVYAAYAFIGMGTTAIVDYGIPEVRLSRFHAHNGTTTTGEYPGLDRYGRVARHLWTDDDFAAHGSLTTVANIPPIHLMMGNSPIPTATH